MERSRHKLRALGVPVPQPRASAVAALRSTCNPGEVEVVTDRRYRFAAAPEDLWSALTRLDQFQVWWPWLRRFEGTIVAPEERWACAVRPPFSYEVCFDLHIDHVDAPHEARATVTGDIVGTAALTLAPHPDGSEARLIARLAPSNAFLHLAARLARPAVRLAHDWVLDTAVHQFRAATVTASP